MSVIDEIAAERKRQIEVEGWTHEHDDQHTQGELARAAGCYALFSSKYIGEDLIADLWLWDAEHWKPTTARRNMIKALALGIAEVERLDRMDLKS